MPVLVHLRALLTAAICVGIAVLIALSGALPAQAYDEDTIGGLVDQARWDNGQNGLNRNAAMDQVALAWAQQLAANGTLSHNPDYSSQIPAGWQGAAENVAQGYATGASLHQGWMDSPGHRANILGDYTDIGIALIEGGGTTWAVEVFGKYPGSVGPAAPAAAPPVVTPPSATPSSAAPVDPSPVATPQAAEGQAPPTASVPSAAATPDPSAAPTSPEEPTGAAAGASDPPVARQAPAVALTAEDGASGLAAPILILVGVGLAAAVALPFVPLLLRRRREAKEGI
ncbi:CAP domain-containing protein [Naasia lichenicola]|uniref:SCP domain-containing protein n=1 Tax=Naasia lichenicola TaxID=2565933 RepID=A0A4S4FP89_9MICO|nr:CAP domain-containing protein [Naasia lichenicola]THG32373.1 hypothetical protein E6C64_04980 [Naasia lichenicola]